ncbi:hypothetical protein [Salinispira pacifica]|uniref:Uncharacterized protein n=1 Tax=Salinispira pacifica TaxID=1307761 RepID=V5WKX6_9SPIO|nr:hypothetical protein [Salinispira pacifica]AHC15846.1 hypothetical protein L21SP2_2493 [Salinispira pacifica]
MDYSKQIQTHEREITINNSIIDQEYWHIGNAARENPQLLDSLNEEQKTSYSPLVEKSNELIQQKTEHSEYIKEIEELQTHIADRENHISGKEQEKLELEQNLQEQHRKAGMEAFELYAASPELYTLYAGAFGNLDNLFRDKYNLENKVQSLEDQNKTDPVFKRLVNQTKLQFQKNQLKNLEKKVNEGFTQAGSKLAEEWQNTPGNDKQLEKILTPLLKQRHKIQEVEKAIAKQRSEIDEIQEKIRQRAGSQKPGDRITDLQLRISELDEQLRDNLTRAGRIIAESLQDSAPEQLKEFIGNLNKLKKENDNKREIIQRLTAAQKIKALEEEKDRFQLKKDKLTRQLEDTREQLKKVDTQLNDLDSEIREQGKIRGSEKDLAEQSR